MSSIFIGITGASASGKSLLSATIYEELKEEVGAWQIGIIKEDSYYKDQSHMDMSERVLTNYDHPNAFDHDLLVEHLDVLREGHQVDVPVYDFKEHNRSPDTIAMEARKVIIVEGILLLSDKNIRKRLDTSIYVDTPLDICLLRRLRRDTEERGRTMESIIQQYKKTVRPMFLEFVEPSKQFADIIVPRGGKNRVAIEMLKARIKQLLG
ncbi:uridine kinase [Hahella ganghwensis]|uniref:uridine kinase n=1 Tax=Hahella ganghwensis TaxID=286420 RepID=UPI00036EB5FD|nr:uridine kinase [Hahella ganghwensis]